jgi:hypothetical protein
MKWIVLAIVLFIAGYTYLTLHFRKPGPEYRPYEDMRNRANTLRLLKAGYQRIQLAAERPAEPLGRHNTTFPAPGGIPAPLKATIVAPPLLPSDILAANGAATAEAQQPYEIEFRCTVPDDKQQLAGAELYVKDDQIVVTPDFELLSQGLLTRSRDTLVLLTVPPGALKPGHYQVTLVGEHTSRVWTLDLR